MFAFTKYTQCQNVLWRNRAFASVSYKYRESMSPLPAPIALVASDFAVVSSVEGSERIEPETVHETSFVDHLIVSYYL